MKTTVESIMVQNNRGIVRVGIRMPNGDLKRRFIMSLLKKGAVLPQAVVNRVLLEVLQELDDLYRSRLGWADKALELQGFAELLDEKTSGEIEALEARNTELGEDLGDIQADIASAAIGNGEPCEDGEDSQDGVVDEVFRRLVSGATS